jgi:hypothetical protein
VERLSDDEDNYADQSGDVGVHHEDMAHIRGARHLLRELAVRKEERLCAPNRYIAMRKEGGSCAPNIWHS